MVVCALPCVSAVVALTFMPESPRFYLEVREKRCIVAAAAPFSLLMTLEMTLKGFQRTVEQPCFFLGFIFVLMYSGGQICAMCGCEGETPSPAFSPLLPSLGYFR